MCFSMAYPQGNLCQPVSAFTPYAGNLGSTACLRYSPDPLANSASYTGSLYKPGFHPSAAVLNVYSYADPIYRKNASQDATAMLKAWLCEHHKNPYPTKGEKVMLAIVTSMTLTQVSTWFANARRRLKKEKSMSRTSGGYSEHEQKGRETLEAHMEQVNWTAEREVHHSGLGKPMSPLEHQTDIQTKSSPPSNTSPPNLLSDEEDTKTPPTPKYKLWSLAELATCTDSRRSQQLSPTCPFPYCKPLCPPPCCVFHPKRKIQILGAECSCVTNEFC